MGGELVDVFDARDEVLSSPGQALCHDLKQPVAAILVIASEAASLPAHELSDGVRSRLRQIEEQAEALAEVIDSTLGAVPDTDADAPATTDLDATLAAVVSLTRLTYGGEVALAADAARARVGLGHVLVRRVLGNVLGNATRAAGAGGRIWVTSSRIPARVVVDVDDDGPGWGQMAPGHGLGLSIVTEVMAATGGSVTALVLPTGGTRVHLEFPIATHAG